MIQYFHLTLEQGRELRSITARAGIETYGAERRLEGRLGMLVTDAAGRFFALVTSTVVEPGEAAFIGEGDDGMRLGVARALKLHPEPAGFLSVSSLISAVPIRARTHISATVGGGSPQRVVAPIVEVLGRPMRLALDGHQVELGPILAHSATTYFADSDGAAIAYKGALILGYSAAYPRLAEGDAGAMIVTREGVPVAIVVGGNARGLVAVPLAELLRRNRLRPISQYDVARRIRKEDRTLVKDAVVDQDSARTTRKAVSPILGRRTSSEETLNKFEGLVQRMRSAQSQMADAE